MSELKRATCIALHYGKGKAGHGMPVDFIDGMFYLEITIGFRTEEAMHAAVNGVESLFSCGFCDGTGKVSAQTFHNGTFYGVFDVCCKQCSGKGFIDG